MNNFWKTAFLVLCAWAVFQVQPIAQTGSGSSINCNANQIYDQATNGSTKLVTKASNSRSIYVCGYGLFSNGTANVSLVYGTGTNCGTGTVSLTPAYRFTAQTGFVDPSPYYRGMNVPAGNDLCISSSAAVAVQGVVYYAVF